MADSPAEAAPASPHRSPKSSPKSPPPQSPSTRAPATGEAPASTLEEVIHASEDDNSITDDQM
ncbi:hypothetical protein CGLO_17174 [Colletotrichum gloeosporioides Cg-14]|uniref:Uncharacterized protein n=1 Tax=Colletotrichum gloeosporioides (strain Cg-14) TaxID=1237896 RepID=T0JXB3_COLGC|nr:hypothetical protein CGLO_17174 [Colletotrichum gloeosporioides Cg-14]